MSDTKKQFPRVEWKSMLTKVFALKLKYRILLYLVTTIFAALALMSAILENVPYAVGIAFYVCAALTLTASCYYITMSIRYGVREKLVPGIEANPITNRLTKDYRYRTVISAMSGLALNILFALFNGVIGILSRSAWFGTLSAYYLLLSFMRYNGIQYDRKVSTQKMTKELLLEELLVCKRCGILFIIMTIVLGGAVILLLTVEEGKSYPGFTIYAVAAYAFYKITMSIINVAKTRKMKSPVLIIIRDIGHVDAVVSILTLQTAMFAAFGDGNTSMTKIMNGITGIVVCLVILGTGIYEIVLSVRLKKKLIK